MGVESIFEMYTLLWGWHQYNAIWGIMQASGLAYVPFFGLIVNTVFKTVQSQDPGDASTTSLHGIEIDLLVALFVIVVAVQPLVPVQMREVSFVKICFDDSNEIEKKYTINNDKPDSEKQTGFDNFNMVGFETVRLPAWWYAVLSVTNGFVRAAQKSMPCVDDVRQPVVNVQSHIIKDPFLISYIKQFAKECYFKAKDRYDNDYKTGVLELLTSGDKELIRRWLSFTSDTDMHWIGSRIFRVLTRYYHSLHPNDFSDIGVIAKLGLKDPNKFPNDPNARFPSCKELWDTDEVGIEDRIYKDVKGVLPEGQVTDYENSFKHAFRTFNNDPINNINPNNRPTQEEYALLAKDAVTKTVLKGNIAYESLNDAGRKDVTHTANQLASDAGRKLQWLSHYTMIDVLVKVLPVIGALILLGLYLFLPIGLVFSSYSLQFLMIATTAIFTVKFYYYLWHVAWWLDQNLVKTLLLDILDDRAKRQGEIINMVSSSMYLGLPILWTLMISWAGISLNRYLGSTVQTSSEPLSGAGRQASDYAMQKATGSSINGGYHMMTGGSPIEKMHERYDQAQQDLYESEKSLDDAKKALDRKERQYMDMQDFAEEQELEAIQNQVELNNTDAQLKQSEREVEQLKEELAKAQREIDQLEEYKAYYHVHPDNKRNDS